MELASAGIAADFRNTIAASVTQQNIHGYTRAVGPERREVEMQWQVGTALQDEPMGLVIRCESVLAMQVRGINRRIPEWDLIVVGVVQGFGERVCAMKLEVIAEAVVDHGPDRVVVRV